MIEWLNSLGVIGHIYFWVGCAATLFLLLQIILMLFSFGSGGADVDGDGIPDGADGDVEVGTGISVFTVKGLTAFFTLGAWVGLLFVILLPENLRWVSAFPALGCGTLAMLIMAFILKSMLKLQQSGNVETKNVVGKQAQVYVSILPNRSGRGKITLTVQGQYREFDAVTDEAEKLSVGEQVVISQLDNGTALVKKVR